MRRGRWATLLATAMVIPTLSMLSAAPAGAATTFSNATGITLNNPPDTLADATPYPSTIAVSGLTGTISDLTVTLARVSYPFSQDIDALLVGPGGQNLILVANLGPSTGVGIAANDSTLTVSDAGTLPASGAATPWGSSPTFRPVNYGGDNETWGAPAPAGPYGEPGTSGSGATLSSVFDGTNPDGTWSLYVITTSAGDGTGAIAGGWSLAITTSSGAATTPPPSSGSNPCVTNPEKPVAGQPHSNFPLATWEVPTSGSIRQSSPTLATVDIGGKSVTIAVFGDEDGKVYVVNAATCQLLAGWPRQMAVPPGQLLPGLKATNRHAVIESTPAVGWLNGTSKPPSIVVGAGSTWDNTGVGEVEAFSLTGQELWDFPVHGSSKNANGVFSSPAIGPVVPGTGTDVVFGSWDYYLYVLDAAGKVVASYHNGETIWSSPALYMLPGQSLDDIFVGLDKTQNAAQGGCVGGVFADLRWAQVSSTAPTPRARSVGAAVLPAMALEVVHESACQGAPFGFPLRPPSRYRPAHGQAIWSSPAIGYLGGRLIAAIGTSLYDQPYGPGSDRIYIYPLGANEPAIIRPLWTATTPGPVLGSPAIGDVALPGVTTPQPAVVDTSFVCPVRHQTLATCQGTNVSAVQAFVVRGSKLEMLWRDDLPGGDTLTSPVLVPLTGEQANDVLVGSPGGLYPLSGGSGQFLYGTATSPPQMSIHSACRLFNSPAVADVSGPGPYAGWYAFELCSDGTETTGGLYAFDLPDPPAAAPAWPMFRGDPSHSGVAWSTLGQPPPEGDPTH